ncbi:MAG: YggT family protein [Bacillota bacterium]|nr:YggT family protein [Bacillota bacterium]
MNLVGIVLRFLYEVFYIYYLLMIVVILLGWTPLFRTGFYRFLSKITGVYLDHFTGKLIYRAVDFTPILGLILFRVLLYVIETSLF